LIARARHLTDRPTVLLFDIDGMLLLAGGAGRRAIARVFRETSPATRSSMTSAYGGDRAIVRGAGALARRATTHIDRICATYRAGREMPRSEGFRVYPACAVLDALPAVPAAVGPGTGNLEKGPA
jgi:hypothetical protein